MGVQYEMEDCGRCGGSGRYSFNMMHGSRCYGCGGSGKRMTKRGAAARAFATELLEVPIQDVGGRSAVYVDNFIGRKFRFTGVVPDGDGFRMPIKGEPCDKISLGRGIKVRLIPSDEDAQRIMDYQASLTKAGKPRKGA